ncbi:hypothetical protein OROGR_033141 [Orobanche gracilis]
MDSAGKFSRKRKAKKQTIEMGEIPLYALRSSNKLSRKAPDLNSSMVGGDVKRMYSNPRTRSYYLRRCKRARPTDIQSLPDELLSDILTRLPADIIHDVARLVCFRWYHIVHSPDFVISQMEHSTYGLMLSCHKQGAGSVLITATQGGRTETCEFSYKFKWGLIGSCNGLALDYDDQDELLYVVNLATRQGLVLPPCARNRTRLFSCGIGYAAASMEYKVTVPFVDVGDKFYTSSLAILTLGVDESWRNVAVKHLSLLDKSLLTKYPLTTEGCLHWVRNGLRWVLTLDVETEIFTNNTVPLPREYNPGSRFLSTGRFLTFLVPRGDLSWEVWGMGSRDGEWSKVLPFIDLGAHKSWLHERFGSGEDKVLEPVGWVKYPEVLALCFRCKCRICIFFNLETLEINSTELPETYLRFRGSVHKNNMAWYG